MSGEPKYTPGPWSHHVDIDCKCGGISGRDHPVAKVVAGDWGDDYPSIRLTGPSLDLRVEAYMEQITYGRIPQEVADANARLIAAAPELLEALQGFTRNGQSLRTEEPFQGALERLLVMAEKAVAKATGQ